MLGGETVDSLSREERRKRLCISELPRALLKKSIVCVKVAVSGSESNIDRFRANHKVSLE
mgnify:CR=1 FL=1